MKRKLLQGMARQVVVCQSLGGVNGFLVRVQARFNLIGDDTLGKRRSGGSLDGARLSLRRSRRARGKQRRNGYQDWTNQTHRSFPESADRFTMV